MRFTRRRMVIRGALIVLGLAAIAVAALVNRNESGYFSPVYSPDGQHIYFVTRETSGTVWGFGVEHFSPPAKVRIRTDQFAVNRMKPDGSGVEVVEKFPPSPLTGRTIESYRGRIFTHPHVALRFDRGELEYEIGVSIPRQPSSESFVLRRRRGEQSTRAWASGYTGMSTGDDVLREPVELLTAKGSESFPCAIVAYDHSAASLKILRKTAECGSKYPNGIQWTDVSEQSRARDIRRIRELTRVRAEYIAQFRTQGMNEGAAILAADRRLADEGYYPKSPQLIARVVATPGEPLFVISDTEFQVGLFNDIEAAIAQPGREVDKSSSRYVVHDHFTTSRALNAALAGGAKTFYVRRGPRVYELRITEPRPATR